MTFGELLEDYIDRHLKSKAKNPDLAAQTARGMVDRYLASWRVRKLGSIRPEDVRNLLHDVAERRGRVIANRLVDLVRRLYYFAEKEELHTGENPARKIELFAEQERTRFLNGEELARLFTALRKD